MKSEPPQLTTRAKRQPNALDVGDVSPLVARIEERLAAENSRDMGSIWKFNKRHANDRIDLITVARNLHAMLANLPHGQRGVALKAGGFGGAEQSGYVGNLTIPPHVTNVGGDRWRRLTPVVKRYIDVAAAIQPERRTALATLFRGTSFDDIGDQQFEHQDWAERLTKDIWKLSARVASQTGLANLFDQMSAANICLEGEAGFDPRITDWLSETFHKFEFVARQREMGSSFWLFDRNDEDSPRCGAPLFSPKLALEANSRHWTFAVSGRVDWNESKLSHPKTIEVRAETVLYLALAPMSADLEEPAVVAPWLIERPEAEIVSDESEQVWKMVRAGHDLTLWSDSGRWDLKMADDQFDQEPPEFTRLFVDTEEHSSCNPDLMGGCWWCLAVTAANLRNRIGRKACNLLIEQLPAPKQLTNMVLAEDVRIEDVDLHAVDPHTFAPWGSVAAALQSRVVSGAVGSTLKDQTLFMADAFRGLVKRLRDSVLPM